MLMYAGIRDEEKALIGSKNAERMLDNIKT
jgi:hypothetical protein